MSGPDRNVTRKEWRWAAVVGGLVVAASTLPYVVGYLAQTAELRFSGALLDRVDYYSYLARMWQGYRGAWSFQILFTPEAHEGVYFQPFHLALGHLARLTGMEMPLVYQIVRVALAFLMLLTIYRFIAHFVVGVRTRRIAFLLIVTTSGLGWLTEVLARTPPTGVSPMDFWLLDGFTYLVVLTVPHFCAAITLLLGIFLLLLRRPEGPSLREGVLAVLASVLLGFIHPYMLLLADLLPLLYWGVTALMARRKDRELESGLADPLRYAPGGSDRPQHEHWGGAFRRRVLTVAAMVTAQLPLLAYEVWVMRTQPVFAAWSAQNLTLSPPPRIYLLGYGALLILAVVGVRTWARGKRPGLAFPLLWIGLVAVAAYVPWTLQRRFLEGVQIPLGLLAGVGLAQGLLPQPGGSVLGRTFVSRLRLLALPLLVAMMSMSNLYLTAGFTVAAASRSQEIFWPADLLAGVDWLGENTSSEETVLADFETGNLIPARIGHRVVMGHEMETGAYESKKAEVARFFDAATSDKERLELLERYGVSYVFYGPYEQALGAFDPAKASYLTLAAQLPNVSVYRVNRP